MMLMKLVKLHLLVTMAVFEAILFQMRRICLIKDRCLGSVVRQLPLRVKVQISGCCFGNFIVTFWIIAGRTLTVTWSSDAKRIFSGSSDGFIRCWDANFVYEIYRITVGLGGLGSGSELCIWSLLALRCGTLVSADSSGSVQFWDSQHGTLLQSHSSHKSDVNALAASPSHSRVFSAGSDGQVILYKLSANEVGSHDQDISSVIMKKWVYVGCVSAHTHDVRALAIAVPIALEEPVVEKKAKMHLSKEKPLELSYHKGTFGCADAYLRW